jgi:hypothetical protein
LQYRATIGREYYNNFIRAAKKQGLCFEFLENISMNCATCHSFIIDLIELYYLIEEVLGSPDFDDDLGVISWCKQHLSEGYNYLDVDGPEAAIIFDKHCSCNHVFVGEPEEEEDNQIDFGMTSGRVFKYIGPRRYWS